LQATPETIEVFDHTAIDEVAELFMDRLPEDFCSLMGPGFLRRHFLPHFLGIHPHIGFVAKQGGQIAGFALGAKAGGYYPNFIKMHFMALAMYSMAACLRDIRKLNYFFDVGQLMFGDDAFNPLDDDLELLYLCVAKGYQGTGIGTRLIKKFLRQGQQLGFGRCVLKTFAAMENLNLFYRKCGFDSLHEHRGRVWFSHPITPRNEGSTT
jgi:GNAT superfamily N-acetyltransferase